MRRTDRGKAWTKNEGIGLESPAVGGFGGVGSPRRTEKGANFCPASAGEGWPGQSEPDRASMPRKSDDPESPGLAPRGTRTLLRRPPDRKEMGIKCFVCSEIFAAMCLEGLAAKPRRTRKEIKYQETFGRRIRWGRMPRAERSRFCETNPNLTNEPKSQGEAVSAKRTQFASNRSLGPASFALSAAFTRQHPAIFTNEPKSHERTQISRTNPIVDHERRFRFPGFPRPAASHGNGLGKRLY